jgi:outer membrane receptor protein involved in Fe transport
MFRPNSFYFLSASLATLLPVIPLGAQANGSSAEDEDDQLAFELSPFEVNTSGDIQYLATNQISGTRINVAIKDTPVSLEVLTSEFINDTGADGFKEALAYSAGIFTDSFLQDTGTNPANGDRSPSSSAAVGDPRNNAIIIRGFNAPFQQRFGFRVGSYIGVKGASTGQGATGRGGVTLGSTIDAINVDRIEVVRGPASLLYGLGVLSGIANILPKEPLSEPAHNLSLAIGTEDYYRAGFDSTGPLMRREDGSSLLDYRVLAAYQERGDWTEFFKENREYYAAQLKWYPFRRFSLFAEVQKGETVINGLGAFTIQDNNGGDWRDPYGRNFTNEYGERNQWGRDSFTGRYPAIWDPTQWPSIWPNLTPDPDRADELQPLQGPFNGPGYRVTGPDTEYRREEVTGTVKMDWRVNDNLAFNVGFFRTEQDIEELKVSPRVINDSFDQVDITPTGRNGRIPDDFIFELPNPAEDLVASRQFIYKTIGYYWSLEPADAQSTQYQIDGRYEFRTPLPFTDKGAIHSFIVGRQEVEDKADLPVGQLSTVGQIFDDAVYSQGLPYNEDGDPYMVKSFYSWNEPIRYEGQPLVRPADDYYSVKLFYQGNYAIYHGRYFDEFLGVITGIRQDRFQAKEERWARLDRDPSNERVGTEDSYYNFEEAVKVTTGSFGLTMRLTDEINVYGIVAEGVIPNTGQRDGDGLAIEPEQTFSRELGLKFDLLDGKISGSIAVFQIDRENAIWEYRNAPAPGKWTGGRNPFVGNSAALDAENIVDGAPINYGFSYQLYFNDLVKNADPQVAQHWREKLGITTRRGGTLDALQNAPVLENGQLTGNPADGVVYIRAPGSMNLPDDEITDDSRPYVFLTYDAIQSDPEFKAIAEQAFADFNTGDHPTNIQPMAYSDVSEPLVGLNASVNAGGSVTFEEEAKGFDGQIIYTPFDSAKLQIIFSFAHVKREATSAFNLVQAQDYRFPELGRFGTEYDIWVKDLGRDNFDDPTDPTTMNGGIKGKSLYYGSENTASLWGKYQFDDDTALEGFAVGLGARYTGPAQTFIPIGGNNLAENRYPTPDTEGFTLFDAALYYNRSFEKFDLKLQLNLYNITDEHRLYTEVSYENVEYPDLTEVRRTERYVAPFSARLSATLSF